MAKSNSDRSPFAKSLRAEALARAQRDHAPYVEKDCCIATGKNAAVWIIGGKTVRFELPTKIQAPVIAMMAAIIGD